VPTCLQVSGALTVAASALTTLSIWVAAFCWELSLPIFQLEEDGETESRSARCLLTKYETFEN